ncbi:MAG TPA: S8/S53 family peptidase [Acidobacteriota bacterium]|nr:S8/S53 family peptidase [Acidobacteriota bacterium]
MKYLGIFCLSVLVTALNPAARSQGEGLPAGGVVPGKFLVKLSPRAQASVLRLALAGEERLEQLSPVKVRSELAGSAEWDRWYTFYSGQSDISPDDIIGKLGAENVEHIEQDRVLTFFGFPTDPLFPLQWHLHNDGQAYLGIERRDGQFNDSLRAKQGTPGVDIGLTSLYETPPLPNASVVVAVVDGGADLTHPELQNRFWQNPDEIPGNGIDDDHNGFVDDTLGYDISGDSLDYFNYVGDNDPTDIVGHGTHIAGIVASAADGYGIVGVAPLAEIMPVKIRPNATSAVGAAGIAYAVNAGADVINLSWGSPYESFLLNDAITFARRNGVFVAIAAGNSASSDPQYPAAFDSAFAVAAGNSDGYMTSFSSWGPGVDLVAPGEDILSLRAAGTDMYTAAGEPGVHIIGEDSLYYLSDGTSMAAPMAAGAAALLLSYRPDLALNELETLLRLGADDMLDPWNRGDSLPGPDTVTGYGYLDIEASLALLDGGSVFIAWPVNRQRHVDEVSVKIATVAGYSGGWSLEYSLDPQAGPWLPLASGGTPPVDSVAYTFGSGDPSGHIYLRLIDDFGSEHVTSFTFVNGTRLEITYPQTSEEFDYSIPIVGSVYGPDLDSLTISYNHLGEPLIRLASLTGEYFDSLIFLWNSSGLDPGDYTVVIDGFFGPQVLSDAVTIVIRSAFASGWPQVLTGRGAYTAACADLDGSGTKEIVVGTAAGLNVFRFDGSHVDGFPVLPEYDCRCVPAIYDIDRDGRREIIFTYKDGIYAVNHDGTPVPGWPKFWEIDNIGSGFPQPVIAQLGIYEDSAIMCVVDDGTVIAYHFDGTPYFYSLGGWFASFSQQPAGSFFWGSNAVSSTDLTGNGQNEVVVSQSSSGVGVFDGRTGQPAFDRPTPDVIRTSGTYGTILADLNHDQLPEAISVGYDSVGMRHIYVKTRGVDDLPGWPVDLPDVAGYRGSYPMVADLDLDGGLEILCTFFEFDVSALYVFRADGSPYMASSEGPVGEVYRRSVTFGAPIVANLNGDEYPEIAIRSGYILPGTGHEQLHILDHTGTPLPGWPIYTPTRPQHVFSTMYTPLVDDIDGDGLVELILVGGANDVYVWNFDASSDSGHNVGRLFVNNSNSGIYGEFDGPPHVPTHVPDRRDQLPAAFVLRQNYPNPFNPSTTIEFSLAVKSVVTLQVFNVLGRLVSTLVDKELPAGEHVVTFDGSPYASGTYFYRLRAGDRKMARKMVLVK